MHKQLLIKMRSEILAVNGKAVLAAAGGNEHQISVGVFHAILLVSLLFHILNFLTSNFNLLTSTFNLLTSTFYHLTSNLYKHALQYQH